MDDSRTYDCTLYGCLYNKNGQCRYDTASIKIPYYQACKDEFDNGDYT